VHIKGAKGCTYTLDAEMRVAKVFVEDCAGCVVRVQCLIVTQHVEMWAGLGCHSLPGGVGVVT
jgi:hypothetical protein